MASPVDQSVLGEWQSLYDEFLSAERAADTVQQTLAPDPRWQSPPPEPSMTDLDVSNGKHHSYGNALTRPWAPLPGDLFDAVGEDCWTEEAVAVEEELLRRLKARVASPTPRGPRPQQTARPAPQSSLPAHIYEAAHGYRWPPPAATGARPHSANHARLSNQTLAQTMMGPPGAFPSGHPSMPPRAGNAPLPPHSRLQAWAETPRQAATRASLPAGLPATAAPPGMPLPAFASPSLHRRVPAPDRSSSPPSRPTSRQNPEGPDHAYRQHAAAAAAAATNANAATLAAALRLSAPLSETTSSTVSSSYPNPQPSRSPVRPSNSSPPPGYPRPVTSSAAAATYRQPPEPASALRHVLNMRTSPGRASAPSPPRGGGGGGGGLRDTSPRVGAAAVSGGGGGGNRPVSGSSYAALHHHRQNSPPRQFPPAPREELFEALHRGVSPHRLRLLLQAVGAAGLGKCAGGGGCKVMHSSHERRVSFSPQPRFTGAPAAGYQQWEHPRQHGGGQAATAEAAAAAQRHRQPPRSQQHSRRREAPEQVSYAQMSPRLKQQRDPEVDGAAAVYLSPPGQRPYRRGDDDHLTLRGWHEEAAVRATNRNPAGGLRASAPATSAAAAAGGLQGARAHETPSPVASSRPHGSPLASNRDKQQRRVDRANPPSATRSSRGLGGPAAAEPAVAGGGGEDAAEPRQGAPAGGSRRPQGAVARRPSAPVLHSSPGVSGHVHSPELFISPQAYREYAARDQQQQRGRSGDRSAAAATTAADGEQPRQLSSVEGQGSFDLHGVRHVQRRLTADLEAAGRRPASHPALDAADLYDDGGRAPPYDLPPDAATPVSSSSAVRPGTGVSPPHSATLPAAPPEAAGMVKPRAGGDAGTSRDMAREMDPPSFEMLEDTDTEFEYYEGLTTGRAGGGAPAPAHVATLEWHANPLAYGIGPSGASSSGGGGMRASASWRVTSPRAEPVSEPSLACMLTGRNLDGSPRAAGGTSSGAPSLGATPRRTVSPSGGAVPAWPEPAALTFDGARSEPSWPQGRPQRWEGLTAGPYDAATTAAGLAAAPAAAASSSSMRASSDGEGGMSAQALSAAAAAVMASAISSATVARGAALQNGAASAGALPAQADSSVARPLDVAAITEQLSHLDLASLELIRGYASGYIDGRVQALPQHGQIRSQVVKAAVLRLVDEVLQAKRQAGGVAAAPPSADAPLVAGAGPVATGVGTAASAAAAAVAATAMAAPTGTARVAGSVPQPQPGPQPLWMGAAAATAGTAVSPEPLIRPVQKSSMAAFHEELVARIQRIAATSSEVPEPANDAETELERALIAHRAQMQALAARPPPVPTAPNGNPAPVAAARAASDAGSAASAAEPRSLAATAVASVAFGSNGGAPSPGGGLITGSGRRHRKRVSWQSDVGSFADTEGEDEGRQADDDEGLLTGPAGAGAPPPGAAAAAQRPPLPPPSVPAVAPATTPPLPTGPTMPFSSTSEYLVASASGSLPLPQSPLGSRGLIGLAPASQGADNNSSGPLSALLSELWAADGAAATEVPAAPPPPPQSSRPDPSAPVIAESPVANSSLTRTAGSKQGAVTVGSADEFVEASGGDGASASAAASVVSDSFPPSVADRDDAGSSGRVSEVSAAATGVSAAALQSAASSSSSKGLPSGGRRGRRPSSLTQLVMEQLSDEALGGAAATAGGRPGLPGSQPQQPPQQDEAPLEAQLTPEQLQIEQLQRQIEQLQRQALWVQQQQEQLQQLQRNNALQQLDGGLQNPAISSAGVSIGGEAAGSSAGGHTLPQPLGSESMSSHAFAPAAAPPGPAQHAEADVSTSAARDEVEVLKAHLPKDEQATAAAATAAAAAVAASAAAVAAARACAASPAATARQQRRSPSAEPQRATASAAAVPAGQPAARGMTSSRRSPPGRGSPSVGGAATGAASRVGLGAGAGDGISAVAPFPGGNRALGIVLSKPAYAGALTSPPQSPASKRPSKLQALSVSPPRVGLPPSAATGGAGATGSYRLALPSSGSLKSPAGAGGNELAAASPPAVTAPLGDLDATLRSESVRFLQQLEVAMAVSGAAVEVTAGSAGKLLEDRPDREEAANQGAQRPQPPPSAAVALEPPREAESEAVTESAADRRAREGGVAGGAGLVDVKSGVAEILAVGSSPRADELMRELRSASLDELTAAVVGFLSSDGAVRSGGAAAEKPGKEAVVAAAPAPPPPLQPDDSPPPNLRHYEDSDPLDATPSLGAVDSIALVPASPPREMDPAPRWGGVVPDDLKSTPGVEARNPPALARAHSQAEAPSALQTAATDAAAAHPNDQDEPAAVAMVAMTVATAMAGAPAVLPQQQQQLEISSAEGCPLPSPPVEATSNYSNEERGGGGGGGVARYDGEISGVVELLVTTLLPRGGDAPAVTSDDAALPPMPVDPVALHTQADAAATVAAAADGAPRKQLSPVLVPFPAAEAANQASSGNSGTGTKGVGSGASLRRLMDMQRSNDAAAAAPRGVAMAYMRRQPSAGVPAGLAAVVTSADGVGSDAEANGPDTGSMTESRSGSASQSHLLRTTSGAAASAAPTAAVGADGASSQSDAPPSFSVPVLSATAAAAAAQAPVKVAAPEVLSADAAGPLGSPRSLEATAAAAVDAGGFGAAGIPESSVAGSSPATAAAAGALEPVLVPEVSDAEAGAMSSARPGVAGDPAAAAVAVAAATPSDTPAGSGASTPSRTRSRDSRGIEPVLTELRAVRATIAAEGDPDGSRIARMGQLLEHLDGYRRGAERRHGPSNSIASQLRILHADMSKWLRAATVANAPAGSGAPAGAGSAGPQETAASYGTAAAAAAAASSEIVPEQSSPSKSASPPRQHKHPHQHPQHQQQHQQERSLVARESQSSVQTDATFDLMGSSMAATPRDSGQVPNADGFAFPLQQPQPQASPQAPTALTQQPPQQPSPTVPSASAGSSGAPFSTIAGNWAAAAALVHAETEAGARAAASTSASPAMGGHAKPASTGLSLNASSGVMPVQANGVAAPVAMAPGLGPGSGLGSLPRAEGGALAPALPQAAGAAGPGYSGGGHLSLLELANQLNSLTMHQRQQHLQHSSSTAGQVAAAAGSAGGGSTAAFLPGARGGGGVALAGVGAGAPPAESSWNGQLGAGTSSLSQSQSQSRPVPQLQSQSTAGSDTGALAAGATGAGEKSESLKRKARSKWGMLFGGKK